MSKELFYELRDNHIKIFSQKFEQIYWMMMMVKRLHVLTMNCHVLSCLSQIFIWEIYRLCSGKKFFRLTISKVKTCKSLDKCSLSLQK